ncbi:serine hydrolase domain-containing protein [Streptomyces sp. NPDC059063]|uniref:serine hydrolase domain-containing protein n=1 Tax=unclassified Streptomyces TaxID=2593676 RepID=UPI00369F6358
MAVRTGRVGAAVVAALAAGALVAPAIAAPPKEKAHERTQAALDAVVRGGIPGVTAQAEDAYGSWHGTSGVGDLRERTPRRADDRFRAGSITKTFVATVVLQLEAEGVLDIDDTVGEWLPGVVSGHGHDGDKITIRRLLNHTSGIHDYTEDPDVHRAYYTPEFFKNRHRTWTPDRLVAVAMRHEPDFDPGEAWRYSNTNYILAGMIIERATGNAYADEIRERVIEPLHLDATSAPGTESRLPKPSSHGYAKLSAAAPGTAYDVTDTTYDVTDMNPSISGAAGEMISDAADLNRYYAALMRGELLPRRQLAEMTTTVPTGGGQLGGGRYGLGVLRVELPCGTVLWGHGGSIHGSLTLALTTPRGGHSLAFNFNGDWKGGSGGHGEILNAEFCRA